MPPDLVCISVKGPVGTGKSAVMLRIKEVLEREFGAQVVLNDELRSARNLGDRADPPEWLRDKISKTLWRLEE